MLSGLCCNRTTKSSSLNVFVCFSAGAGKTTLLNTLAGRVRDYTGAVTIAGRPVSRRRHAVEHLAQPGHVTTLVGPGGAFSIGRVGCGDRGWCLCRESVTAIARE